MTRHLFVPGLFGPMPGLDRAGNEARFPVLEKVLARANRRREPSDYAGALLHAFGIAGQPGRDLPTAAIAYLADAGRRPDGFLFHADPLILLPDQDRLLAFDMLDDPLDATEVAELLAAFNRHFADDGLSLQATAGGRLYLACGRPPRVRTPGLDRIIGRNVDIFLPTGEDRGSWRALLNETQMLCHGLAFNAVRESRGRPPINGLWFSGGGELPAAGRGGFAAFAGEDPLVHGLQALCGTAGRDELLVEHGLLRPVWRGEAGAWLRALQVLETRLGQLVDDSLPLVVHACNGAVLDWNDRTARRIWRRRRSLARFLDTNPDPHGGPESDNGL